MVRGLLFSGTLKRVKVCMNVGTNANLFRLFFGAIEGLGFDPGLWNWKVKRELINYDAREGKKLFNLKEFFFKKCVQEMKPSPLTRLQVKMARSLGQEKEQKEVGFLWSL
jgi:hypothetical protein